MIFPRAGKDIRIKGLTRDFYSEGKRIKARDNVDLTMPANHVFTVTGASGRGKATLLRCIVGLSSPDAGELAIGADIVWSSERNIFVPPEKAGPRDGCPNLCHLAAHERF